MNPILAKLIKKAAPKDTNKLVAKQPDEDFIPYVCHYDPNTILTKNGELLQIIRITGFSNESIVSELISLRDAVRDAVIDRVKDNNVALWFNTIRRKKNITPKGEFTDPFSKKLNEAWVEENGWTDQYVNELYITVIVEGIDTSIVNANAFMRSFSYIATKALHHKFLQEAHKKLSRIVAGIVSDTEEYGAKLLGISDWDGVLYSEPMRFFGKIVNLYEERYPLSANDISNDLASHKIAFGNRELEVLGYKNKNFAAILSLKEYFEVSTNSLDRILQLPFEFIITQSFDFTYSKKELEPYEYQNYILQISGDEDFRQMSGVANFAESKHGLPTDYGKLQTTIMLINKNLEGLEKDVKSALEQFSALGFVVVREDIFSESCFWSQLPGNFRYLCRQKVINTYRVAGFAALHSFPAGIIAGNHWGPAVTVLKTVLNTPYFFNFHEKDLGHSLILGPKNSGKNILLNFLIAQGRRFNNKLFYFDFNNASKCFIKAMSGHYYDTSYNDPKYPDFLHLNPLSLPKNSENQNFLNGFFANLVTFTKGAISESEMRLIPQIVDRIFAAGINNFPKAVEIFNTPETKNIYDKLKLWVGEKLGHIFGSDKEINWLDQIIAFDITEIAAQKAVLIPTIDYLLYRIEMTLDKSPAIIVLNEAWDLLDNAVMAPKLNDFLARMRQKNCAVIFTSEKVDQITASNISAEIKKNLVTEIFMPNGQPQEIYKNIFALTDEEIEILKAMDGEENHFLFKHSDDSIIAALNLSKYVELAKILDADETTLTAMEEVIQSNATEAQPNSPIETWLPQLFEVLKAIESARLEEEKQKQREEFLEQRKRLKERMRD